MANNKKILITLLSVFMVCLIASSVTTVVANDYWGNLKVGDEMTWEFSGTQEGETIPEVQTTFEILAIADETLTVKATYTSGGSSYTIDSQEFEESAAPFILAASEIESYTTETYTFKGTNYKAAYFEGSTTQQGVTATVEWWLDYETGITFEGHWTTTEGDSDTTLKLQDTTADLTEGGGAGGIGGSCLGTILIALVSVVTGVSYGLVRYHKKKLK